LASETAATGRSQWQPILPVPDGTPIPRHAHSVRGEPYRVFTYRDGEGRLLGYTCRFMKSSGGVVTLTQTWAALPDGTRAWRWMAFPKLRPIYGADLIQKERAGSMVLIVGDEYVAEELRHRQVFKGFEIVSWPGGRGKIGEVDWSPLRERIVLIWLPHSAERFKVAQGDPQAGALIPIEKQPWRVAALRLKDTLREHGVTTTFIVQAETTDELPDQWTAVTGEAAGWDDGKLYAWFEDHWALDPEKKAANLLATPSGASGEPWMKSLIRKDGTGALQAELHNVRMLLSHHPEWRDVIYLDEFSHTIIKARVPPFQGGTTGEWADTDDSMAADWLSSTVGILKLRTSLVAEAVQTVAKLKAKNPLQEHLRGLKWDKQPRIGTWLRTYLNAGPITPEMTQAEIETMERYLSIVGRLWLLGAVKRGLQPGCKFDYMLILEGLQGLGKSSVMAIIGGAWAMDTPFSLHDKEGLENIRGKWLIEIAELDAFNKAESSAAKSFFSRQVDRFRLPYAKRSLDFKRSCAFGGTVNEGEYFRDATGNRRYWPVHCPGRGYDREALERDRDQLLAEAVHLVLAGAQHWPTKDEEKLIRKQQGLREVADPWVGKIARGITEWEDSVDSLYPDGKRRPLTREMIITKVLHIDTGRIDERSMAVRVGRALHKLGYIKIEDKSLPERFRYEKRQGQEQDDQ